LNRHPAVKESVVVQHVTPSRTGTGGIARLIAYVALGEVFDEKAVPALTAELNEALLERLPDYMVPSAIMVLGSLSRTPNGKIDRKALPDPSTALQQTTQPGRDFAEATTPQQQKLASIWTEILQLDRISVNDSIFELGADSLLIFRIAARAQREGLPVTSTQIFQHRTISALAKEIEKAGEDKNGLAVKVTTRIAAASRDSYRYAKGNVK
jgi:aryl carrier-like protein